MAIKIPIDPAIADAIGNALVGFYGTARVRETKTGWRVPCKFHSGTDPNFEMHKSGVTGRCWVCGKTANYVEYRELLGKKLPEISALRPGRKKDKYSDPLIEAILRIEAAEEDSFEGFTMPNGTTPWRAPWRDLPGDFLYALGTQRWYDDWSGIYRILWPIVDQGVAVGYVAGFADPDEAKSLKLRACLSPTKSKYPTDGKHRKVACDKCRPCTRMPKYRASLDLPTTQFLYGLDWIHPDCNTIIIVEGLYDSLRFMSYGLPTVPNIGTAAWSGHKNDLLNARGFENVVLVMDGDKGGEESAVSISKELHRDVDARIVKATPPKGEDPGSVPTKFIRRLRSSLRHDLNWGRQCFADPALQRLVRKATTRP